MFVLLKQIDPTFGQWFEQGWTLKKALERRLDLDATSVAKAYRKHSVRGAVWYFMSAWNGLGDDDGSTFDITWGHDGPNGIDSLIFDPQEAGPTGERLIQTPVMTALLRALAVAWEPQVGIVISSRHDDAAFKDAPFEYRIGWLNYFARSLGPLPPLPDPVRVESVDDIGSLVILTPERFVTSNPAHVALSLQVSATLRDAGVLKPLLAPPPPSGATP